MRARATAIALIASLATLVTPAGAQQMPPIRPLGPVVRVSAPGLVSSVSAIRTLPGGRVIVNDIVGRRVVLLDSTLAHSMVVVDSGAATGGAFGGRVAGIIAFRGDSTLFVDPATLSLLVIDPQGKVARVMAAPRPQETAYLIGGPFGTPAFDPQGRLIYHGALKVVMPQSTGDGSVMRPILPDSAPIVRVDIATRKLDTLGQFKVMHQEVTMTRAANGMFTMSGRINPMQMVDDWAAMPDGSVAIIRGSDYHVDWVAADGARTSSPRIPFEWQRMTDEAKVAYLDSTKTAVEKANDAMRKQMGTSAQIPAINLVSADALPDYRPAFGMGAARADADGNLWIRTSTTVAGAPVYDVLNRQGVLMDRVQLPHSRVIAGFAPGGIVYMGVLDGQGARVEEARVR